MGYIAVKQRSFTNMELLSEIVIISMLRICATCSHTRLAYTHNIHHRTYTHDIHIQHTHKPYKHSIQTQHTHTAYTHNIHTQHTHTTYTHNIHTQHTHHFRVGMNVLYSYIHTNKPTSGCLQTVN